ncbi:uncharacterized protein IL334_006561 [Kwoniella shivajii]|uniref:Uncharacterized protein n=1 Tax=Kwoniella shivajii TaxID=564305 RepID=A0ABZ1D6M8_9TREE|nr:hypothetical protein IL334_006561 [Kwoniella shivajii]
MSASSSTESGPSTLRSRSHRPPSLRQTDSHQSNSSAPHESPAREDGPKSGVSAGSSNVQFPGGLYLPAVKGTIGGIESPRRHVRGSASISTLRNETPTTPNSKPSSDTTVQPHNPEQNAPPPPPASRAIFRSDHTIKSCLLGLKMDKASEIARLFGAA